MEYRRRRFTTGTAICRTGIERAGGIPAAARREPRAERDRSGSHVGQAHSAGSAIKKGFEARQASRAGAHSPPCSLRSGERPCPAEVVVLFRQPALKSARPPARRLPSARERRDGPTPNRVDLATFRGIGGSLGDDLREGVALCLRAAPAEATRHGRAESGARLSSTRLIHPGRGGGRRCRVTRRRAARRDVAFWS